MTGYIDGNRAMGSSPTERVLPQTEKMLQVIKEQLKPDEIVRRQIGNALDLLIQLTAQREAVLKTQSDARNIEIAQALQVDFKVLDKLYELRLQRIDEEVKKHMTFLKRFTLQGDDHAHSRG